MADDCVRLQWHWKKAGSMFATTSTQAATAAGGGRDALARLAGRLGALLRPERAEPIGLEIAAQKLHMVQFDSAAREPLIRAAISIPYTGGRDALLADGARLKALVARALASRPFHGREVVSCLPATDVNIVTLSYQRAAGEDDTAAIVRELRERLKGELDKSVVDYLAIRGDSVETAERNAIVVSAPRERVLAYLAALRHAGLEPVALDAGPAALARLVSALDREGRHPNALLVNFGQSRSYMSVIWGRRLMLDRELDFGESQLTARLGKTLDMPEDAAVRLLYEHGFGPARGAGAAALGQTICEVLRPEFAALTAEVNKTLIYTASKTRGQSVERVYLLGSIARCPGIAEMIEGLVAMPVEVVNAFKAFPSRPDAAMPEELEPVAGLGLATGLALRGRGEHG
jgi:type IV pilus assembly protein PilM